MVGVQEILVHCDQQVCDHGKLAASVGDVVGADHLEGFIELFILDVTVLPQLGVMCGLEVLCCLLG